LKLNILNINFYIFLILLIFNLAFYYIFKKINFNYDINKKLEFMGKLCLFTFFSLFLLYLYFIYSGIFLKFFNFCSPFKPIYCETSSTQATNELNRNLTSNDEGKIIKTNNNSNNHRSTNINESNNNSNIGNNNNNTTIQPTTSNTNNDQQPNITTTTRTETHTFGYTIQNSNFSNDNLPLLDSRSNTPTPTNTHNFTLNNQHFIDNKTSQSKHSN